MSDQRGQAGGAAMGAGGNYQARVAALLGVYALAELDAQPPMGLTAPVEAIACEVPDPVDDIVARTTSGHTAAIQAKRTVSLNRERTSADGSLTPFASAIDQFVRQYHLVRERARSGEATELDPAHDRFVLAVGPRSPITIRQTLAAVLDRIRIQPSGEPLLSPVLNRQERDATEALIAHARASWEDATGSRPSDSDLHEFLRLVRVETLAVEEGEANEAAALTILRLSVLDNPEDARHAWGVLVEIGSRLIASRSSIAASQLRSVLAERGIPLRGARSYREDIERLRRHTAAVIAQLTDYATVPIGDGRVPIERPYIAALREASEDGSVLLVGEPGIGKSGAIHGFSQALLDDGRDVVVLTAQDPPFSSLPQLRDALGLEHDAADVLANWPGGGTAFLIIDALDAARTDSAAQALRQLIDRVQRTTGRWHVVASVREYDARYGRELRRLFRGAPPEGPCPALPGSAFAQVRHLLVGELSDREVEQLASAAPRLHALATTAPPALARLFRTPFNLRLAGELLGAGTAPDAIREVQSQLELLDLYWSERVLAGGEYREAHAREAVLTKVVRSMVQDRRLQADTQAVADDPAASSALADLLRAHVLTEWRAAADRVPDRYSLTFAHHVLFDYAAMRLLLPRDPARLAELLGSDPEFVLLARPSLVMHFHERWAWDQSGGHEEFWNPVLAVAGTSEIPEIGKLLGPSIAADLMRNLTSLEPLLHGLESGDATTRAAAENAFYHLVRSAAQLIRSHDQEAVARRGALCALLERVSRRFTDGTAYPARTLLWDLTDYAGEVDPHALSAIGAASRHLLEFAWVRTPRDRNLVAHALQYVCRTFSSDRGASAELLRRAIASDHLAAFGSEELRWIAREIEKLAKLDPDLVRDIYTAAFSYREESDEPSPMGGIVMPLTSNRRQDYDGALYLLRQSFSEFITVAPEHAIAAMSIALKARVDRERTPTEPDHEDSFGFYGIEARIATDYSRIWDRGHAYPGDYAIELLDEVASRVSQLAEPGRDASELRRFVVLLASSTGLAAVWRRLLRLGERLPDTLGVLLRPLLWVEPVMTGFDTTGPAGRLIRATAPHLPPEDRERIERAIMVIPETACESRREDMERVRDRLLGCFGEVEPVTEDAGLRLATLRAEDAIPEQDDDRPFFEVFSRTFDEEEYLAEEGVPVEEPPNRRIRELETPVALFASIHRNSVADSRAVLNVLPDLKALREALASADADGVHPYQAAHAWGTLAEACSAVAAADVVDDSSEEFAREVLLAASRHPDPKPSPDADIQFVDPHWGKPAVRIDSAEGLLALAARSPDGCTETSAALEALMADPVPSVRFQLAIALHRLYGNAPDRCWSMLESRVNREVSPGVASGLLQGPLFALRFVDPDRVVTLTRELYVRFDECPGSKEVRNAAVDLLANLHVALGHAEAGTIIAAIPRDLLDHLEEAAHLVPGFREALVLGPADGSDPDAEARRERAIDFVLHVTRAAADAFRTGVVAANASVEEPQDKGSGNEQLETLAHLLDSVAWNLYFTSGAYRDNEEKGPGPGVQHRLLMETGPIIDELADIGLAPIAHHLLETLEVLIPCDPSSVFTRVVAVIRGGRKGHYQYDRMAEDVLVRVIERYLADYRTIFQQDQEARRALIEILDTFVQAGSEGARRLSYGLDGIFR